MKTTALKVCSFFLVLFLALIAVPFLSAASEQDAKVNDYIRMLQSLSPKTRINAAKYITRSGITDPRLYNIINEKLLSEYNSNTENANHVDEMSWMCKALAASGAERYAPTLEKISETARNPKLKKYAKQSLSLMTEYAERNRIINSTAENDPELSAEVNQYINMLRSNNINLKRDAAKLIYRHPVSEKKLFDVLRDQLLKDYQQATSQGSKYTDTIAWMCKALGSSGLSEYRAALTEIVDNSSNSKIVNYAKQGRRMLE